MIDMIYCHEQNSNPKARSLTATGFSFCVGIRIGLQQFEPLRAAISLRRGLLFCTTNMSLHCIICTNSNFSGHFHFLQIRLDGSNYHIFPPCFAQMKRKIDGSSGHKHERTLQFFTFFPVIYSTYTGSARKKSTWIFLMCVCSDQVKRIFPSNICLYIIAAATWLRIGVATQIDYGHILPRIDANSAQIGTGGAIWLRCNLCLVLVRLISEQQINVCHVCAELRINDHRTLFYC